MRKFFLILLLALPLHLMSAQAQEFTESAAHYANMQPIDKEAHRHLLERVDQYFKNLTSIKSQFRQTYSAEAVVSRGMIYLERPGKLKLEYIAPDPLDIYINDDDITVYEKRLDQISYSSMEALWARLLTGTEVSLFDDDVALLEVKEESQTLLIRFVETKQLNEGVPVDRMTLIFNKEPFELARFYWTDANNYTTSLSLINPSFNIPLDKSLFVFQNPRLKNRR